MEDVWKVLESKVDQVIDPLWNDFAKVGKESAVLAPLAKYPRAAAWLARGMATSNDYCLRKLGARLAGWIDDAGQVGLLPEMLSHERQVFREDSLSANSVGEDIMFGATRWAESHNSTVRDAGIEVLVTMIGDALGGTPWNTANWAVANLHHATQGRHPTFRELTDASDTKFEGQQFLQNVVEALKANDMQTLGRSVAAPSKLLVLSPNDPHYALVSSLWSAAAAAEATFA